MKYRSILEFGLNNWYNWLVETKKMNRLNGILEYLVVLLEMLKKK